mgnify:CR=1 FL=1
MNIARARLVNQGIANPTFDQPGDVVTWLGALQAQDYLGSLWAIGLRMVSATERDIEAAIAARTIVRTWPMRGTLHFVAAHDVHWLLELLTPRVIAQSAGRYRQLALDEATFAQSKALFAKALQGGQQFTRDEMVQVLEQANIATAGQRGYHILGRSAQDGLICFGAPRGKQQTFTLLDEWIPPTKPLARDETLAELTKRYFTSHGPALLADFVWWSGLTSKDARIGIELAKAHLEEITIDDQRYWFAAEAPRRQADGAALYLLPGFDEFMLGYTDRHASLDALHTKKIQPGGNGIFSPTIVIDGKVTGTWKRTFKRGALVIELDPFRPLTAVEHDAFRSAAQRYGEFLGLPVSQVLPA